MRKGDINEIINQLVGPRSPRSSTPAGSPHLAPRNFSPTGRVSRASGASSDRGAALLGDNSPASGRVSRGSDTGSDIPGQGRALQLSPAPDSGLNV